jgi:DNA polymerase (family X)
MFAGTPSLGKAFLRYRKSLSLLRTMAPLDAPDVARLLIEYGRRTALAGGNPYRSKAYLRAAENLAALAEPLDRIIAEGRLREIPGVGDAIADIVTKLHRTGTHPSLERMRKEIPEGVLEMLSIPGLRPEKVNKIYKELGIASLAELEAAARRDRIRSVKGLGVALQRKILQGLEIRRTAGGARHMHRAAEIIAAVENSLQRTVPGLERVVAAGDFRRGSELVSNLALVAQASNLDDAPKTLKTGELSIYLTDSEHFGISLLLATGSPAHLQQLRALAESKGFQLVERGLQRSGTVIASKAEIDIYRTLGLQYIEPELREGRGEIALARKRRIPRLVSAEDIRGILHAHTDASDGVHTLEQMAEATRKRGYHYFGVADHSKSAHYAGGLSVAEIEEQHAKIDRLNEVFDGHFRIFKGIESDILPDGSLDYPDEVLRRFNFIVASVHGQFRMERDKQTERILRAVANPFVTILGHMTGRQLLRRPGYEVDIEKILAGCAKHDVAVEINANPWRLDLDWRWHQRGLELGCMFSINPDAHSTAEIDLMRWGLAMARKGGVSADRVLNTLPLPRLSQWLEDRKASLSSGERSVPNRRSTLIDRARRPLACGRQITAQDRSMRRSRSA